VSGRHTPPRGDGEVTFTIVAAGSFHADVLAALHATCFPRAWDEAAFATLLASPGVAASLALAADETPVGFLLTRAVADEAEILTIGVLPSLRGRGAARALLADGLSRLGASGVRTVWLEVAASNAAAQALYARFGFHSTGRRLGYYEAAGGAREDALLLRRVLGFAPAPPRG
jgi:ribosomal-protein-alanine N-acetyltransferase